MAVGALLLAAGVFPWVHILDVHAEPSHSSISHCEGHPCPSSNHSREDSEHDEEGCMVCHLAVQAFLSPDCPSLPNWSRLGIGRTSVEPTRIPGSKFERIHSARAPPCC